MSLAVTSPHLGSSGEAVKEQQAARPQAFSFGEDRGRIGALWILWSLNMRLALGYMFLHVCLQYSKSF